jgi:intergrase/recombinase
VRAPRFEPGSSAWQTDANSEQQTIGAIGQQSPIDWKKFKDWLTEKKYRKKVCSDMLSYARQFSACLTNRDLSKVAELRDSFRPNVMKALSALAKFLGIYEEYKQLIRQYGLKWGGRSADDLIIDRLTKIKNPDEVWTWIKQAKKARPDLTDFLDLMAVAGLRLVEAVNCYNLIIKLARDHKLKGYYNAETGVLEHFRFKEIFIRKSKKAFTSFVPEQLITRISQNEMLTSPDAVQKLLQKKGLKLRFADIRETHATYLTKFLKPEEIDFLHGRVTTNVFMRNYYNPKLIADLHSRTFQGIQEIQEKVKT